MSWAHARANTLVLLASSHRCPSLQCCSLLRHCFGNTDTLLRKTKQKPGCSVGLD